MLRVDGRGNGVRLPVLKESDIFLTQVSTPALGTKQSPIKNIPDVKGPGRAANNRPSWNDVNQSKEIYITSRDSSVGVATRYGLDGPAIESRWGARLSAPIQTGPGAHPASYIMGTGSFPGVKRPGRGVDHPPHPAPMLKSRAITLLPLWAFVVCFRVNYLYPV